MIQSCLSRNKDIFDVFECLKYKRNDTGFKASGILVFCGPQGSGKTYSMVQYVRNLVKTNPKVKVISNVMIEGVETLPYQGIESIVRHKNGIDGLLVIIDEMHLEFNSLESREIGMSVFVEISQQRKQRVHIVGTSQVYMRLAKPFREQMKYVVLCKNFLGCIQWNTLIDGEESTETDGKLNAKVIKRVLDIHKVENYKAYDTYAKIERVRQMQAANAR